MTEWLAGVFFVLKKSLKEIGDTVNDRRNLPRILFKYSQWYFAVIDVIECKIYKPNPTKARKKAQQSISKNNFSSKAVEPVNLLASFNNSELMSPLKDPQHTTFMYKLKQPTSSSIFNCETLFPISILKSF